MGEEKKDEQEEREERMAVEGGHSGEQAEAEAEAEAAGENGDQEDMLAASGAVGSLAGTW